MEIKYAVPKGQVEDSRPPSSAGGRPKKIYIAGIPVGITEADLQEHFAQYGKVLECYIQKDRVTGDSRGFAFLTFENADSVDKVLQKPRQSIGDKGAVDVKVARPKGELPRPGIGSGGGSSISSGSDGWSTSYGPSQWYGYGTPTPAPGYAPSTWDTQSQTLPTYNQPTYPYYAPRAPYQPYDPSTAYQGYNQWNQQQTTTTTVVDDTKRGTVTGSTGSSTGYDPYGTQVGSVPTGASSYDPAVGADYTYGALRNNTQRGGRPYHPYSR